MENYPWMELKEHPEHLMRKGELAGPLLRSDTSTLDQLLQRGDLPSLNGEVTWEDNQQYSLLHYCAKHGILLSAKWLLEHDAEVNITEPKFQCTPLHYAEDSAMVLLLLKHGAQVDHSTTFLATPLHFAAYAGNTIKAILLLIFGADVNAQDKTGLAPVDHAVTIQVEAILKKWKTRKSKTLDSIISKRKTGHPYQLTDDLISAWKVPDELGYTALEYSAFLDDSELAEAALFSGCTHRAE